MKLKGLLDSRKLTGLEQRLLGCAEANTGLFGTSKFNRKPVKDEIIENIYSCLGPGLRLIRQPS